jgi:hypothetical protein
MADRLEHIAPVASVPSELEGSLIVAALKEEGLDASMTGVYTAGFRAEAPGLVQVQVADSDLARAKSVLQDMDRERDAIDWSQVDVGEPGETLPVADSSSLLFWRRIAWVLVFLILILVGVNVARAVIDITSNIYAKFAS